MASIINTNIASLNAQRNLTTSQSSLTTALQRLSSGLRINSAKDDAAGLAISERFTTQIRGLNQSVRNANDGISLAQTGEAALGEISNNLQRIRELSVQAANSTNSAADRAAINLEVQQRLSEIDRTAATTSFNGQKLFDGNFGTAAFQVGANAGESISIGLTTNMRNSATGAIATATAGTLGASGALSGRVATATVTSFDFSAAGSNATAGRLTFDIATSNFQGATGLIAGTSSAQSVSNAAHNFSTASVAQVDGTNVQAAVDGDTTTGGAGSYDFSGTDLAQFDITDGVTTRQITLTADYTDETGLVNAINTQLAGTNFSVLGTGAGITFTNNGSTTALQILNADANAVTAGFANSAGTAGSAAVAGTSASLTIDGTNITLTGNNANGAAVAAELTSKMQASALGANYSAAYDGVAGTLTITHAGSASAVAITNVDANAAAAGFANSAGVAGVAASGGNAATLTIDGQSVTLNQNYGSNAGVAAAIGAALGGSYNVTESGGTITVARTVTGAGSAAVTSAPATGAGAGDVSNFTSTAGAAGAASSNATFYVDGNAVNLTTDTTNMAGLAAEVQTQLQAFDSSYTAVAGNGTNGGAAGTLVIAKAGNAAVNITGADANATAAGLGFKNGQAGIAGGTITLAAFSINGTSLNGTYASVDALASAINSGVSGVYASNNGGSLQIQSASAITLTGADATGVTGFNAASVQANSGSLSQIDVSTTAGALTALQRVDSTLNSVSSLRSTFGAIQNRFESVINSLSTTAENLTSARSRIQDADFAAETAAMTRGQILQQAGTAMLAQANSLPNGVLALLRG